MMQNRCLKNMTNVNKPIITVREVQNIFSLSQTEQPTSSATSSCTLSSQSGDISSSFGEESGYFTSTPDYFSTSEANVFDMEEDVIESMFNMSMENVSTSATAIAATASRTTSTGASFSPVPCNFSNIPPANALRLRAYINYSELQRTQSKQSALQHDVATQTGAGLLRQSLRARPASAPIYEEILGDAIVENADEDLHEILDANDENSAPVEWMLADNRDDNDDVFRRIVEPLPDLLPRIRNRSISVPLFQNCDNERIDVLSSSSRRIRVAAIQLRQLGDDFQLSRSPEQRSTAVFPLSFWRSSLRSSMSTTTCRLSESTNSTVQAQCAHVLTTDDVEPHNQCNRRCSLPSASISSSGSNSVTNVLDSVMQIFTRFGRHSIQTPPKGSTRTARPRFFSENTQPPID